MKRILFAWELGSGLGHVAGLQSLGMELRRRGHRVTYALKDLYGAERHFGRHGLPFLQAPRWLRIMQNVPLAANYGELLLRHGYLEPEWLTSLVKAWRELFARYEPDALICEFAPTALLASRGLGFPRVMTGTGFTCPPPVRPMPSLLPWANVPAARLAVGEQRALDVINQVLGSLGSEPLPSLGTLFEAEETLLMTFPELDPFKNYRSRRVYRGANFQLRETAVAPWPSGDGKRIFGYLKPEYPRLEHILQQLKETQSSLLIYAPELPTSSRKRFASANVAFLNQLQDLRSLASTSDLVVCHAGHGTLNASLLAGCPLLMLPMQVEQTLNARQVESLGAGLQVTPKAPGPGNIRPALKRLLQEPAFRERARSFAATHGGADWHRQQAELADRVEALASG